MPVAKSTAESRFDYILQAERELPSEEQTVFKCKQLTTTEYGKSVGLAAKQELNEYVNYIFLSCVLSAENFKDESGRVLTLKRVGNSISPKELDRFEFDDISEIANYIAKKSSATNDELGK